MIAQAQKTRVDVEAEGAIRANRETKGEAKEDWVITNHDENDNNNDDNNDNNNNNQSNNWELIEQLNK